MLQGRVMFVRVNLIADRVLQMGEQVRSLDFTAVLGKDDPPLDNVGQFPDVTRPVIVAQGGHRAVGDTGDGFAVTADLAFSY